MSVLRLCLFGCVSALLAADALTVVDQQAQAHAQDFLASLSPPSVVGEDVGMAPVSTAESNDDQCLPVDEAMLCELMESVSLENNVSNSMEDVSPEEFHDCLDESEAEAIAALWSRVNQYIEASKKKSWGPERWQDVSFPRLGKCLRVLSWVYQIQDVIGQHQQAYSENMARQEHRRAQILPMGFHDESVSKDLVCHAQTAACTRPFPTAPELVPTKPPTPLEKFGVDQQKCIKESADWFGKKEGCWEPEEATTIMKMIYNMFNEYDKQYGVDEKTSVEQPRPCSVVGAFQIMHNPYNFWRERLLSEETRNIDPTGKNTNFSNLQPADMEIDKHSSCPSLDSHVGRVTTRQIPGSACLKVLEHNYLGCYRKASALALKDGKLGSKICETSQFVKKMPAEAVALGLGDAICERGVGGPFKRPINTAKWHDFQQGFRNGSFFIKYDESAANMGFSHPETLAHLASYNHEKSDLPPQRGDTAYKKGHFSGRLRRFMAVLNRNPTKVFSDSSSGDKDKMKGGPIRVSAGCDPRDICDKDKGCKDKTKGCVGVDVLMHLDEIWMAGGEQRNRHEDAPKPELRALGLALRKLVLENFDQKSGQSIVPLYGAEADFKAIQGRFQGNGCQDSDTSFDECLIWTHFRNLAKKKNRFGLISDQEVLIVSLQFEADPVAVEVTGSLGGENMTTGQLIEDNARDIAEQLDVYSSPNEYHFKYGASERTSSMSEKTEAQTERGTDFLDVTRHRLNGRLGNERLLPKPFMDLVFNLVRSDYVQQTVKFDPEMRSSIFVLSPEDLESGTVRVLKTEDTGELVFMRKVFGSDGNPVLLQDLETGKWEQLEVEAVLVSVRFPSNQIHIEDVFDGKVIQ